MNQLSQLHCTQGPLLFTSAVVQPVRRWQSGKEGTVEKSHTSTLVFPLVSGVAEVPLPGPRHSFLTSRVGHSTGRSRRALPALTLHSEEALGLP